MIVPNYWAEAIVKYNQGGRRVTIKRFGWSDISQEDAQKEAQSRADEALNAWLEGKLITLHEKKINYNGADGLPIREQVISRHNDVVITRNSYGALCLNTPDVMFADIDFEENFLIQGNCLSPILYFIFVIAFIVSLIKGHYEAAALFAGLCCLLFLVNKIRKKVAKPIEDKKTKIIDNYLKKIELFLEKYPKWGIRVYETPAGLRLLITHRTMLPDDSEVSLFFKLMKVDPVYARMCKNQQCFRARVSAKPWRIDMNSHIKPRPGVWPVKEQYMATREDWVAQYNKKAENFAACRFIKSIGNATVDNKVAEIITLHDELSKANTDLAIA
ncbi:hypothetical protein [Entomomonas asaccharolytica]|uniref:Uncharacterized protein n=1 Tax=Entomomonas asaccharolytica TaxID=2785331 RepID=A0A974NI10_9GAMM|nr:hypothetical protein [Entomomonas asaccharolytica]QQP86984.1 hypothetical protein JHT90_06995 [Entomomonas asaccharolytica]